MGAFSASPSRSDKTMILAPSSMALETSFRIVSILATSDFPPPAIGKRPRTTWQAKPG